MLERLTKYLGAWPRRAAMIVMTLAVALILVVSVNLFQLLDLGSHFESPYRTEETPLSLVADGIRWDNPIRFSTASYNLTRFYWQQFEAGQALSGPLANDSDQIELSSGSPVTVVKTVAWAADMSYQVNVTMHDSTGDGVPGSGDYIIFTGPPWQVDTVYTIALAYIGGPGGGFSGWEFDYAIHDGVFYSWESDMDNTSPPWWYNYV